MYPLSGTHSKGEPNIMNPVVLYKTSRRTFLQTCGAGVAAARSTVGIPSASGTSSGASASPAVLHVEPDPKRPLIPVLSWDTEGGERFRTNLLRSPGIGLRVRPESLNLWLDGTDLSASAERRDGGVRYRLQAARNCTLQWDVSASQDSFVITLSTEGSGTLPPGSVEMVFPFDLGVTPMTVLPTTWHEDEGGTFEAPLIISAPDFGQMLMRVTPQGEVKGRLEGYYWPIHVANLILELPSLSEGHPYTFSFTPATLASPVGLQDDSIWRLARRGWFNAFQPQAISRRKSDVHDRYIAPGVLGSYVGGVASIALYFFADMMIWTPKVAEDISVAQRVRQSVDCFLENWTLTTGEVIGYLDYVNFLDANPSLLISAWDYVEATGDLVWLERTIDRLEFVADFDAYRDQDRDGLVEATQSGNAGTFWQPARSSNWDDAVNFGYKDAYANALIYRAWRCLADLEAKLHHEPQRAHYTHLADQLKGAYAPALYNPESGLIACWRSADGKLHDYASPIINGMAVEYGLVESEQGRKIIDSLWAKMQAVGFTRFDLGVPLNLEPVHRSDYLQPDALGLSKREDGTDSFQQYENGGITAGMTLHFLVANYLLGYKEKADKMLQAMLGRQQQGAFQNGLQGTYPHGWDWRTWDGKPCGYEGYLADVYYFLQAVVLREPAFRKRYLRPLFTA